MVPIVTYGRVHGHSSFLRLEFRRAARVSLGCRYAVFFEVALIGQRDFGGRHVFGTHLHEIRALALLFPEPLKMLVGHVVSAGAFCEWAPSIFGRFAASAFAFVLKGSIFVRAGSPKLGRRSLASVGLLGRGLLFSLEFVGV